MCYNDAVASQLLDLLSARGMRVPQDISVVGIDDANIAQMRDFTSFPHPKEELGRKVAENMLRMIEDPTFRGDFLFDAEPVRRGSVGRPGSIQ